MHYWWTWHVWIAGSLERRKPLTEQPPTSKGILQSKPEALNHSMSSVDPPGLCWMLGQWPSRHRMWWWRIIREVTQCRGGGYRASGKMSPRQTVEAQIFYKTPQSYIIASWPQQAQGSPVIGAEICVDHCNIATQTLCCVPDICSSAGDGGGWILTEGRKLVRFQAAVSPTLKISELFISILIDVKPIKTYSACVLPVGCSQTYSCKNNIQHTRVADIEE